MRLLFVFCCLSASCVIWTEASPFFFNLQKTFIPQTTQIQRRPVVSQGTNFGLGGLISKWFPGIVINKQFGTRRPKATQRPVIEVTTIFVPSVDLEKEDTNETLGLSARPIEETSSTTTTTEQPFEEIFNNSEKTTTVSTTTTEEAFEEVFNNSEKTTTTTITAEPFEEIFNNSEKTTTTTTEGPFEEIFNNSEKTTTTTTTTAEPFEEIFNNNEKTTTTTTEGPFEEIFNNSEKTTTTTEEPFEEILNNSEKTTTTTEEPFGEIFNNNEKSTTKTAKEPFEEIFNNNKETATSTTTTAAVPFEEIEPFTESKTTTTTTELPFEETEPLPAIISSTDKDSEEQFTQIKTTTTTTTTTELPFEETADSNENTYSTTTVALPSFTESKTTTTTTTTEVPLELSEIFTASKIPTTISTESYESSVGSKTSTTSTELPSQESEVSNNSELLINQIGFTTEGSIPLTSTEVIQPNSGYLSSNSDKEQIAAIKPTTYRPLFVPTATNAPWKETPSNIINTGGLVEANKPPQSYVYVRPDISADDVLLNEVSSNSRPFETLSVVGTTSNGKRVERIYKPQASAAAVERPRVTFYSNY